MPNPKTPGHDSCYHVPTGCQVEQVLRGRVEGCSRKVVQELDFK